MTSVNHVGVALPSPLTMLCPIYLNGPILVSKFLFPNMPVQSPPQGKIWVGMTKNRVRPVKGAGMVHSQTYEILNCMNMQFCAKMMSFLRQNTHNLTQTSTLPELKQTLPPFNLTQRGVALKHIIPCLIPEYTTQNITPYKHNN